MALKIQNTNKLSKYRRLSPAEGSLIYSELVSSVKKAGILDRSYLFYALLTGITLTGFIFSLYQFMRSTNILALVVSGTAFTFFTVQIGGLVHDAGHRAIYKSNRANDIMGQLAAWLVAFRYSTWKTLHNAHHANPNQEGDPDIGAPWIFTDDRAKNARGIMGFFFKYQAWFYYPLGLFGIVFTRFGSLGLYFKNLNAPNFIELSGFMVGVFLWYILPFFAFPLGKAVLFLILTNNLGSFYLTNIFAPNHKGMPQIGKNVKFSFLEQQIITARNIYGHPVTDYVYLGLNYQIEHHLFPYCPRNKLKLITPFVREICRKYRLDYTATSIIGSNRFILRELKKISASS